VIRTNRYQESGALSHILGDEDDSDSQGSVFNGDEDSAESGDDEIVDGGDDSDSDIALTSAQKTSVKRSSNTKRAASGSASVKDIKAAHSHRTTSHEKENTRRTQKDDVAAVSPLHVQINCSILTERRSSENASRNGEGSSRVAYARLWPTELVRKVPASTRRTFSKLSIIS
jgi:hypothetical protein